jgi:hypothetical protein
MLNTGLYFKLSLMGTLITVYSACTSLFHGVIYQAAFAAANELINVQPQAHL